jgi:hypothetical protein
MNRDYFWLTEEQFGDSRRCCQLTHAASGGLMIAG